MPNDVFLIAKEGNPIYIYFHLNWIFSFVRCSYGHWLHVRTMQRSILYYKKNYNAYSWQDSIIVVKLKIICSIAQTRHQQWILIHWFPISPLGWFLARVKRLISASRAVFTCDPHKSLENHQNHQMGQFSTNFVQISHDWKKVEHRRFKGKTHLWTFDCRRKNVQW